jgi:hypothetical protein
MRTAALASFAIGATAGIFAVGSSIQMLADEKTRSADCNAQKVCSPAGLQANSELGINGATNVALWAVTMSGLGVGTFLILTNPANRASTTSVGIAPNASGANLMVRGLF